MTGENPRSTARIGQLPIHPMLAPFPLVCFVGTLVTDLAYWGTASVQWETFSVWLLTAGLVMAGFAILASLADFIGSRSIRSLGAAWLHLLGSAIVIVLSTVNAFVHSRDGYTAVVPTGLTLSAMVVVVLAFSSWMGLSLVFRHRVGVAN